MFASASLRNQDLNGDVAMFRTSSEPVARPVKEELRRTSTFTEEPSRHESISMPFGKLAHLHHLNEIYRQTNKRKFQGKDTSDEALGLAYGSNGSWHMYGKLPREAEEKYSVRKLACFPPRSLGPEAFAGAAVNTKGCKNKIDKTIGQDNFSISRLTSGWEVFCLMDGHGHDGHWPATRAVRTIPFFLQSMACDSMLKHGQVEAALLHAFQNTQSDLVQASYRANVDLYAAGCTAVCLMRHERSQSVYVANCGDSRALVIVPGKGCVEVTRDHKPTDDIEKERVEKAGARVETIEYDDGVIDSRIYVTDEDYPGLGMTRSLGDICLKDLGVTAEPEVMEWKCGAYMDDAYLFLASDGVWEFLTNEDVTTQLLRALGQGKSCQAACDELLLTSRESWNEHEGNRCDDITMILAPLKCGKTVSSETWCAAGVCKAGCTLM